MYPPGSRSSITFNLFQDCEGAEEGIEVTYIGSEESSPKLPIKHSRFLRSITRRTWISCLLSVCESFIASCMQGRLEAVALLDHKDYPAPMQPNLRRHNDG